MSNGGGLLEKTTSDMTGMRFGNAVVISREGVSSDRHYLWKCVCDCGKEFLARGSDLKRGRIISCGCVRERNLSFGINRRHGMKKTRLYSIWRNAKTRCNNSHSPQYRNYGARGISFYEPWRDNFDIFASWAFDNGYSDNLELDRIDNEKGYSPDNCRWVTRTVNASNKRTNHLINFHGITHTIAEWSRITGVPAATIRSRLNKGLSIEEALSRKDNK